jgi:hypothetical protein
MSAEQRPPARFLVEVSGDQLGPDDFGRIRSDLDALLQAHLASEDVTALVSLWNTGCLTVAFDGQDGGPTGATYAPIHVADGEPPHSSITLQAFVPGQFHVFFPWCNSWDEVWSKALRVYSGTDASTQPVTYIFQEYRTHLIRCVQYSDAGNGSFPGNSDLVYPQPASYFDLMIQQEYEHSGRYIVVGTPHGTLG